MVKEFKDWLFVKVPEDATEFMISCAQSDNDLLHKNENGYNYIASFGTTMNQYQIIGKGDKISELEATLITQERYLPYGNFVSLLRSLEMEPGTCLVLKKQTKLK